MRTLPCQQSLSQLSTRLLRSPLDSSGPDGGLSVTLVFVLHLPNSFFFYSLCRQALAHHPTYWYSTVHSALSISQQFIHSVHEVGPTVFLGHRQIQVCFTPLLFVMQKNPLNYLFNIKQHRFFLSALLVSSVNGDAKQKYSSSVSSLFKIVQIQGRGILH